MKRLAILGSTGSIGRSTLSVVERYPDRFEVATLAAGNNVETALEQALRWKPHVLSLANESDADAIRTQLRTAGHADIEVVHGAPGTVRVATHPDVDFVVSAIVGVSGLEATYEAVRAGKVVGLANKECLVVAGELIVAEARKQGKPLLPIDSEHNAVHQCLRGGRMEEVARIWLTASGGPFLKTPKSEFASITVEQALNHPTWKMGKRITIDSATLMNKGFEVIEGHHLFGIPIDRIEVVIHPESICHSMVEFADGSILAQLGQTDMRLPILNCLTWPERFASPLAPLDLAAVGQLTFERPDLERFPCLVYAREAAKAGGTMPAVLNAANEAAVGAFIAGRIGFMDIPRMVRYVMDHHTVRPDPSLEQIEESHHWALERAEEFALASHH